MFQIIGDTKIDFLGFRRKAAYFSLFLLILCAAGLVLRGGPLYSIDFSTLLGALAVTLPPNKILTNCAF